MLHSQNVRLGGFCVSVSVAGHGKILNFRIDVLGQCWTGDALDEIMAVVG